MQRDQKLKSVSTQSIQKPKSALSNSVRSPLNNQTRQVQTPWKNSFSNTQKPTTSESLLTSTASPKRPTFDYLSLISNTQLPGLEKNSNREEARKLFQRPKAAREATLKLLRDSELHQMQNVLNGFWTVGHSVIST